MHIRDTVTVLCCPECKSGDLSADPNSIESPQLLAGTLKCKVCSAEYGIHGGIPDLVPHDLDTSDQWSLWRNHLAGLEARRRWRLAHPDRFAARVTNRSSSLHRAFAEFANIKAGVVLDVGCGPGNFRRYLDLNRITYIGIDPLPVTDQPEFFFARAVAESIPFRQGTFTDVVVMAALDHFRDVDAFFREVIRVLRPGGRLHLVQSVHDVRGPLTAVRWTSHWIKDLLENSTTQIRSRSVPKHMTEFGSSTIRQALDRYFCITAERTYSKRWYSPTNLFLSLRGTANSSHASRSDERGVMSAGV